MNTKKKRYDKIRQEFLRDITYLYRVLESCTEFRHFPACDSMRRTITHKYKGKLSKYYLDMFTFNEYELRKTLVIEKFKEKYDGVL